MAKMLLMPAWAIVWLSVSQPDTVALSRESRIVSVTLPPLCCISPPTPPLRFVSRRCIDEPCKYNWHFGTFSRGQGHTRRSFNRYLATTGSPICPPSAPIRQQPPSMAIAPSRPRRSCPIERHVLGTSSPTALRGGPCRPSLKRMASAHPSDLHPPPLGTQDCQQGSGVNARCRLPAPGKDMCLHWRPVGTLPLDNC
jgi:hypothetical protein